MVETSTTDAPGFEAWAIVEVMGHSKLAGYVSEQSIGGTSFVRVDVPATDTQGPFTKLLGSSSIFSITPVAEDIARAMAGRIGSKPVSEWDLPTEMRTAMNEGRRLLEARSGSDESDRPTLPLSGSQPCDYGDDLGDEEEYYP